MHFSFKEINKCTNALWCFLGVIIVQENVRYPNNTEVFISQSHAYKNSNSHSRKQDALYTRLYMQAKKKRRVNFLGCLHETSL
jgi:Zn-finger nucleic acid-binding protein